MEKATRIISNILFVVLAVSLILAILAFLIPRFTSIQYRAVRTGSMEPEIPVGSVVVVVPTPEEQIQVGDDVTYITQSNQIVTHRVLGIDRDNGVFTTYGVANGMENTDPPVRYENIIGVAKFHVPWIGPAVIYLNTLSGKIVALTVILGIAILGSLLSVIAKGGAHGADSGKDKVLVGAHAAHAPSFKRGQRLQKPKRMQKQRSVRPEETDAFWNGDDEM